MTLYLKYRSTNLDELDLPEVAESLKKILANDNIPHAFLFSGPKGTGKTSAARILAKIINCVGKNPPCDDCEECVSITNGSNLDVIELDAASHRGIDDVRTLRDAVKLAPTSAKKKIYIIDEAHMLTTEASNALLKTLEEPPSHVIFILATTNPEKLIDTIKSRVTVIPFRKATEEEIKKSLKRVIEGEKIKIADEVVNEIAKLANGAFRDAIKMLEQFTFEGEGFLKKNQTSGVEDFVNSIYKKDLKLSLKYIKDFSENGVSVENVIKETLDKVRMDLLEDISEKRDLIPLIELLIEANRNLVDSPIEELPLEIAIIKWCEGEDGGQSQRVHSDQNSLSSDAGTGFASSHSRQKEVSGALDSVSQSLAQTADPSVHTQLPVQIGESVNDDIWKNILSLVKPINASIEALLRSARPINYDGKTLTLGVFYKFHKERLEDQRHRKILEDVIAQVLNSPTRVVCTMVEPPAREIIQEAKVEPILTEGKDQDIIKAAEEIFSN